MAVETSPLTRDDLREELRSELDRTLRHYATKADLAALETRITQAMAAQTAAYSSAMAEQSAAHTSALADQAAAHSSAIADLTAAMASQTRWLAGLVLAAAAVATSVVIVVDRLAG